MRQRQNKARHPLSKQGDALPYSKAAERILRRLRATYIRFLNLYLYTRYVPRRVHRFDFVISDLRGASKLFHYGTQPNYRLETAQLKQIRLSWLRWQVVHFFFQPLRQFHRFILEWMRERQRAFLQEQFISLGHLVMLQNKNRNPIVLQRLGCPRPCAARLRIRGDHDSIISEAIDQTIASHRRAHGEPCIGTVRRDQA